MKARHIYMIGMAALVLTGCVKDELFDTSHPHGGKITVTADWTARGLGIAVPESWNIAMGGYSGTETAATHTPGHVFPAGGYTLVAWNPAADISVAGTTATVSTTPDGLLAPAPAWLFTSVQEVTVNADRIHAFTAPMRQQVRQLTLTIMPVGDAADRVVGMECTLTGVAGSMDFAADTYGSESAVPLHFTKVASGEYAGAWTATVRLLGVTGQRQYLSGLVTFADGSPQPMPIESDMTEVLCDEFDHFNDYKADPKLLSTWTETPMQPGFTATITSWQVQDDVDVDIK